MDREIARAEEARRAVLGYLWQRSTVAQTVDVITQRLRPAGDDFQTHEIKAACAFLTSDELLKEIPDELGSSKYYQITAKGSRLHERSQSV